MTKTRNQYIYKLIGQIHSKKPRKKAKYQQHFWQLNVNLTNKPEIKKIFAFKDKLSLPTWQAIEQNEFLGKCYCFSCRNYQGSYYLINWEEIKE